MIMWFCNFGSNLQSGMTVCETKALTDESMENKKSDDALYF